MPRPLFFLVLLVLPLLGWSSSPDDSLTTPSKALTEQVEKLNTLAFETRTSDPTASLGYSMLSLKLSIQGNYATGEINALVLMGMVYKNIGAYDKAMVSYFNAMHIAEEAGDKLRISSCLNNIGGVFQIQGNFAKALQYYSLSMHIEEELGNKEQLSIRLYNMGAVYETIDSLDKMYQFKI